MSQCNGVGSHVKLSVQIQACTIMHTVMNKAGLGEGGGGGTVTDADNLAATELCKTITRSKRRHINRFVTVKGSVGGSIASTDLTTLILQYAVIGSHGIWGFCKAPAANNHTVIVRKASTSVSQASHECTRLYQSFRWRPAVAARGRCP